MMLRVALVGLLLTFARTVSADVSPTRITVHHDGAEGPLPAPLTRFFTLGEPMAYVDWLCLETDRDRGSSVELPLARLSVLDDDGVPVGRWRSASGATHRFRAFHVALGNGATRYRYCTRVLPRGWGEDSVRFVATRDASRITAVAFAIDGDARGCEGVSCGVLAPRLAGFTYGATAASYGYVGIGAWSSAELVSGGLGLGVTRLRVSGALPLLYIAAGFPKSVRLSAQAGLAFPLTFASTPVEGGGSAIGPGLGAYWAQCLDLRTPIAPRLCLGAEVDATIEGVLRGGALDDVRPRLLFSWYVALGAGPR